MERLLTGRARRLGQLVLDFAERKPGVAAESRACEAEIGAWHARQKEKCHRVAR